MIKSFERTTPLYNVLNMILNLATFLQQDTKKPLTDL